MLPFCITLERQEEKGKFTHKLISFRNLRSYGIQIGPFAAYWAILLFQTLLSFSTHMPYASFLIALVRGGEKGKFIQKWMSFRNFRACGIQTGSFAAYWDHFGPNITLPLNPYAWCFLSYYTSKRKGEREIHPEMDEFQELKVLWYLNWTICSLLGPFGPNFIFLPNPYAWCFPFIFP